MVKSNRKPHDSKRALAIKNVAAKYQCTESYVRMVITGTTNNGRSEEIMRDYNKVYKQLNSILNA